MSRVAPKTGELVYLTNRIGVTTRAASEIYDNQGGICRKCRRHLGMGVKFEIDHRIALALGGTNARSNLEALCIDCHKAKTAQDMEAIARAKRRAGETGSGPKRQIASRPFQKGHTNWPKRSFNR